MLCDAPPRSKGIDALVIDNPGMTGDFLLGQDWLISQKIRLDAGNNCFEWVTGAEYLTGRHKVIIYGNGSTGITCALQEAMREAPISAKKARKYIKSGARAFYVNILAEGMGTEEPLIRIESLMAGTGEEEEEGDMHGMTQLHNSPSREGEKPKVTVKDMKTPPTDEDFIALLNRNLDMCQPLPLGLPPERDLGPLIPL